MTPEQQAREILVSQLRAHAQIEDEYHRLALNQAANEIETLGSIADAAKEGNLRYRRGLSELLTKTLREALYSFHPVDSFGRHSYMESQFSEDNPERFDVRLVNSDLVIRLDVEITHKETT